MVTLEKAKETKEAHGEFQSECPGYCGAQDTFYVGTLKGVARIYQQTFIDTCRKVVFAKLYDRKTPITAADLLNDRVLPFFEEHEIVLSRMLTDRGTEYCGSDGHEYELYLALEDIDHTRTKAKSPQTNRICERFHKTVLNPTGSHFVKRSTQQSKNFKAIWTPGLSCTMKKRPHQGRWWENSDPDLCRQRPVR
jgi:transposase InsO family protein